ncbi:MAG: P-loop NTPase [Eubacteriales bacterium]|nr:P-loop NTPase [Eubacteriales bacterium]
MTKIIIIASGKGGTGKTSLAAGVGAALAKRQRRVLVVDGDSGLRNLDIVLGMSDRVVFSFADVASGMIPLMEAAAKHPSIETLFLLTAPAEPLKAGALTADGMRLFARQAEEAGFDYILLDGPAGLAEEFGAFAAVAQEAIVVTCGGSGSLRGAERMARFLEDAGVEQVRLVVNRIRRRLIRRGAIGTVDDAMDATGLCLLGIVPEDEEVSVAAGNGRPLSSDKTRSACAAYQNIALRLDGEEIPLMRL